MDLFSIFLDLIIADLNLSLTVLKRAIMVEYTHVTKVEESTPHLQVEQTLLLLVLTSAIEWALAPATHEGDNALHITLS